MLFNYVHDISRTPQAVANLMRFAGPGCRVAMAGMKFLRKNNRAPPTARTMPTMLAQLRLALTKGGVAGCPSL
jgi:hypothetical protein